MCNKSLVRLCIIFICCVRPCTGYTLRWAYVCARLHPTIQLLELVIFTLINKWWGRWKKSPVFYTLNTLEPGGSFNYEVARNFSLFLAIINSLKVWIGFLFRNTSPMKHVFVFYQSFTWTNTRLLLETYFIPDIRPKSVFSYAFHPHLL